MGRCTQWVTYAHYCKFNEAGNFEALSSAAQEFNIYLDNVESGTDGPFTFVCTSTIMIIQSHTLTMIFSG